MSQTPASCAFLPLPQLRAYPAVGLYPRSDSLIFKALRYFLLDSALKKLYAPHRGRGLVPISLPHCINMKRSALCLAILCVLSHPSAWAETKELWAYGVSKNSGWYDTTKVDPTGPVGDPKSDSQMCWAATAANMLSWWQHWDASTPDYGTTPPQGALNIYNQLKADYGSNLADTGAVIGIDWWFNGSTSAQFWSSQYTYNGEKVLAKGGGYYAGLNEDVGFQGDYFFKDSYLSYSDVNTNLLSSMQSHQTVGLAISRGANVGHSITLWGVEYDTASNTVSKLYVTDSDDYGRGLITLTTKEDDGKMFLLGDGYYSSGSWYVDNFVTLDLNSLNASAGADSASGYNSNFYALENGVITNVSSGSAPSVDGSGNVTYSGEATYSSSTSGLNLHAGSTTSYKEINNVNFRSQKISLSNVILEAHGEVTADRASLVVKNATLIGNKISLGSETEVEMTNAWIETTGTEKGEATNTTFKGTGTIKNMKIDGGKLISGNSPGLTTLEDTELVSTTLSFYLGAGVELEKLEAAPISIKLDTTLESGVVVGSETKAVSSGFLLTSSVTLSPSITLDVWNTEYSNSGERSFSYYSYDGGAYFSEGDYIQVIAFGEGVTYHDVLGTTFTLKENITNGLLALMDPKLTNATWQKQVRTDGVYLVLSSAAVLDVPEPATGVLVLTGLGLLLRRRRRA